MDRRRISVLLADDNLIVREGVRAMLGVEPDLDVVGVASDYDGLVASARRLNPQVLVTDIRMPPTFHREGITAAREVRKLNPGTGIVILSQYDEPDYAISLLAEGANGYAYLLKDRIGEAGQLATAVRKVASGSSMLDPKIVDALVTPVTSSEELTPEEESLLNQVAEGRPLKVIAASLGGTPTGVSQDIERLFLKIARGVSAGAAGALERLRMLHSNILEREEQEESLTRLLPAGVVDKLHREGRKPGESEKVNITVLMSDVRGFSTIAETIDPGDLASQLQIHRREMSEAISSSGGIVWQFVGDGVMAVFGAPLPQDDHPHRAVAAALDMQRRQAAVNKRWAADGLKPFGLGIGISTGEAAAALLGSDERMEYSLVGDTVNLAQRLQQLGAAGETILSETTYKATLGTIPSQPLEPVMLKGRQSPIRTYRIRN